jgi:hypothetical protein
MAEQDHFAMYLHKNSFLLLAATTPAGSLQSNSLQSTWTSANHTQSCLIEPNKLPQVTIPFGLLIHLTRHFHVL